MSSYHSDKCTDDFKEQLKTKVINLLKAESIDISKLQIKAFNCYGGDVRVYLNSLTRTSKRERFRRTEANIKDGEVVGYFGTKGKHQITERDYVAFNEEDFTIEHSNDLIKINISQIKTFLKGIKNE